MMLLLPIKDRHNETAKAARDECQMIGHIFLGCPQLAEG